MMGLEPAEGLVLAVRSTRTAAAGFCACLAGAFLLAPPAPVLAQDGSSTTMIRPGAHRTAGALVGGTRAGGLLKTSGTGILATTARNGLAGGPSSSGPAGTPRLRVLVEGPVEDVPLLRTASALERGWRLVGGGALGDAGELEEEPKAAAWAPGRTDEAEGGDDEVPFLVRLFDARNVMLWIRDVREWGEQARGVLFGPRGIVRAGSVPGSERPRIRLELTDSRPGAQVVIITR